MAVDVTREHDRRTVGRISRRPSAWLAWLLWVLIVALGEAVFIPYQISWFYLTHPFLLDGEGIIEVFTGLIMVLSIPAFATVGAVVATLRPKNGVGWLCLAFSLLLVLVGVQPGVGTYGIPWRVLEPMQSVAWNLTFVPLPVTLMLLIFPDGRLLSRRWWAVVAIALGGYVLMFLGVYIPGDDAHVGWPVGLWLLLAALLASVASVVLRWRRSTDQERQQLKWLVYVVAFPVLAGFAGLLSGYVWASAYVPATVLVVAQSLSRYQNRAIEAAQVIEELIQLAREMREANARGEALDLTEDEVAFYDALEANDSAVQVLGDDTLRAIARKLVATVRANVTIDWTMRENVRAHLRVLVKRILRKNGYPPDKQEQATRTVLEQAEALSQEWAVA